MQQNEDKGEGKINFSSLPPVLHAQLEDIRVEYRIYVIRI